MPATYSGQPLQSNCSYHSSYIEDLVPYVTSSHSYSGKGLSWIPSTDIIPDRPHMRTTQTLLQNLPFRGLQSFHCRGQVPKPPRKKDRLCASCTKYPAWRSSKDDQNAQDRGRLQVFMMYNMQVQKKADIRPLACDQHPEGGYIYHRQGTLRASTIEFFKPHRMLPACG